MDAAFLAFTASQVLLMASRDGTAGRGAVALLLASCALQLGVMALAPNTYASSRVPLICAVRLLHSAAGWLSQRTLQLRLGQGALASPAISGPAAPRASVLQAVLACTGIGRLVLQPLGLQLPFRLALPFQLLDFAVARGLGTEALRHVTRFLESGRQLGTALHLAHDTLDGLFHGARRRALRCGRRAAGTRVALGLVVCLFGCGSGVRNGVGRTPLRTPEPTSPLGPCRRPCQGTAGHFSPPSPRATPAPLSCAVSTALLFPGAYSITLSCSPAAVELLVMFLQLLCGCLLPLYLAYVSELSSKVRYVRQWAGAEALGVRGADQLKGPRAARPSGASGGAGGGDADLAGRGSGDGEGSISSHSGGSWPSSRSGGERGYVYIELRGPVQLLELESVSEGQVIAPHTHAAWLLVLVLVAWGVTSQLLYRAAGAAKAA